MTIEPTAGGFPGAWYAAFYNGERRHWWWPLCRDGFRHVSVFGYCPEHAIWLLYDVALARTYVRALSSEQMDAWVDALPSHRRIVNFEAADPDARPLRLGFWCTTAAAHLLGVRSRALRPEALYRDLIAQGARPAFESDPE